MSEKILTLADVTSVRFLPWQSIFARTAKKPEKNAVKTGNSRNNFSTLNWMEILWCNYNALLNQLMPVYLVDRLYLSFVVTYQRQILHIWSDSGVVEN